MAVKGAKNRRIVEQQETAVLNKVKDMTFDSVTKELAGVQVELQKTMAELSGQLAEQFQLLEDVQKTITLKREELKELQQIEAAATTLDDLKADIEDMQKQQTEMEAEFKRKFAEQQSETKKVWTRQQDDYQYEIKQKEKLQSDALAEMIRQREKANKEKQEQLEKNWAERETELKKREQELAELRAFKEQAPEMVKKAVNQEVAIANNSLKKEYEHKAQMAQKDAETEKKLADAQKAADAQTIAKLHAQITSLEQQRDLANQRAADTTTKALESASGRSTTEAMQRLLEAREPSGKSTK
jgi:hypothetical protein